MDVPSLEELLKAGVHFGHKAARWHPKAGRYIFGVRNGVHIIDLEKTREKLESAVQYAFSLGQARKNLLLVGTKKQARETINRFAREADLPYVVEKWVGGTLTNFEIIAKNFDRLAFLKRQEIDPDYETKYTKWERQMFSEEKEELERRFGGIAALKSIPDALFMVDIKTERTALAESRGRGIPVIAITDTNTNPALVEYPIPANDDGIQAIELMTKTIVDAYQEGRNQNIEQQEQQQNTGQQLATESTMKEENSKFEAPNSK